MLKHLSNISLARISVYDIESKTWYLVTASGDIPEARVGFCAVVSASPNHSTYQVTIFGGWNTNTESGYDNIYVLTVPSFRWIKINGKNDFETPNLNIGRANHRCVIYNDAQMIVLGGSVISNSSEAEIDTSCRQGYPPIRVLDTGTYTWKQAFDPSIEYSVPDAVTNVIGEEWVTIHLWTCSIIVKVLVKANSLGIVQTAIPKLLSPKAAGTLLLCRPYSHWDSSTLNKHHQWLLRHRLPPQSREARTTNQTPPSLRATPAK